MDKKKQKIIKQIKCFFNLNNLIVGNEITKGAMGFYNYGEYEMSLEVFLLDLILEKKTDELIFTEQITPSTLLYIADGLDTHDEWCNVSHDDFWDMYRKIFTNLDKKVNSNKV